MSFSWNYFFQCLISGIKYIPTTLFIGIIPLVVGLAIGSLIALVRVKNVPVIAKILEIFVSVQVGVPLMVSLLIFYLVYLVLLPPVKGGAVVVALFALTLNRTSYMSEIVRGAFLAIPKLQWEAAFSCGLTFTQVLRRIAVPQMIPVAIPPMTNNIVAYDEQHSRRNKEHVNCNGRRNYGCSEWCRNTLCRNVQLR